MKKIYLLMLALICSVVGMAQSVKITLLGDPTSAPESGKLYAIQCNAQHDNITTWMYDAGAKPQATAGDVVSVDEIVPTTYLWKFEATGNEAEYTAQNYSSSKYISIDGTANGGGVSMSATEKPLVISVDGDGYYVALKNPAVDQWIDMGYSGLGISTWNGGVAGSRRMLIYEVEIESVSELASAIANLSAVLNEYNTNHPAPEESLIGESYGQYSPAAVEAYAAALEYAEMIIDAGEDCGLEPAEIEAAAQAIKDAWDAIIASRKPFSTFVAPGYYVIKSAFDFSKSTTVAPETCPNCGATQLTLNDGQYECDACGEISEPINTTLHYAKAIYEDKGVAKWKTFEPKADFLFKVEASETENIYKLTNMLNGLSIANIAQSANTAMTVNDNLFSFDWRSDSELVYANETDEAPTKAVPVVNIRLSTGAERAYQYAHAGGHGGGAGVSGNIVGWSTDMAGIGATDWYLEAIDEATALAWIEAANPIKKIAAMIDSVAVIKSNFPSQKTIAIDNFTSIESNNPLITDASQFHSPMTTDDEQTDGDIEAVYPFLLDGDIQTYWHSRWEDGKAPNGSHYLQVSDIDAESIAFVMTRRPVANDHVTSMSIWGYDSANDDLAKEAGVLLAEVDLPFTANDETLTSAPFLTQGKHVIRFYAESEQGTGANDRGYWHCSEFQIYPAKGGYYYGDENKTQAHVRASEIAAVEAAIEAWNAAGYTTENVTDPEDAAFVAAYNAVVNAYAAWTAVYADPTALRNAIKNANTYTEMIVIGDNPGQWSADSDAAQIKNAVEAATAYDMTGTYTPETMAEQIEKVNAAQKSVADEANQVIPGKWYTIRFATEDEYDEYGWDKTGAVAPVHGDLYENYIAPANRIEWNDEGTTKYDYEYAEEIFKGQQLRFMRGADDSYFRFVEVEGGLALQHRCGWYVSANGTLTDAPAIFSTEAIGYGKSLIRMRQMNGEDINAGGTPSYMHAQVAGHMLVAWAATAIDSRSALYIENADETVVDDCQEQVLPGGIRFLTSPMGISYSSSEVQLYNFDGYKAIEGGLELAFSATDKAEAGKAVLRVVAGEYPEKVTAETERLVVDLTLGETLAAVPDSTQALVGTYSYQWVDAADTLKTVTIFENEMQISNGKDNTDCARDISAYTGAINLTLAQALESTDGKDLVITVLGASDVTGIADAVQKITKANGKIYTIDGKYVGNGNIGTARNMGAGIYIINGVKISVK